MTLEHTSAITASSSRTSASVDGKGKRLARHSWSRRSTKWSADDSSRSSRCNGRCAGPIFCCRPGRGSSTRIWTTYSAVGIQNSGRKHKRRSQSARRLDPRLFGALLLRTADVENRCDYSFDKAVDSSKPRSNSFFEVTSEVRTWPRAISSWPLNSPSRVCDSCSVSTPDSNIRSLNSLVTAGCAWIFLYSLGCVKLGSSVSLCPYRL